MDNTNALSRIVFSQTCPGRSLPGFCDNPEFINNLPDLPEAINGDPVGENRQISQGLAVTNVGKEKGGGRTLSVKGADNLLNGWRIYTRGSYPYGYMNGRDAYRKLYGGGHLSRIDKKLLSERVPGALYSLMSKSISAPADTR